MNFDLTEAQEELRARVRAFCEKEVSPRSEDNDVKGAFPLDMVPALAKEGLFGIIFPKEYGGQGLDTLSLCLILEELGRADAAIALTIESHNGLCTNHLFLHANEAQKKKYLPSLTSGKALGAWALTEPQAGSDAGSIQTKAVFNGKSWVLNGSKTFTTQGSVAGVYVVFARNEGGGGNGSAVPAGGLTAFVMEKNTPGFSIGKIEHKMGIRASDTAQLHLQNVMLPPEAVIGKPGEGFRQAMKVLDAGRVAIAAVSVGIARAALEEGVKRVKQNPSEFGMDGSSAGLTGAQKILAQVAAEVDGARLLTWRAATLLDEGRPYSREASMAKLIAGDLAMRAPTDILDLFGLEGGLISNPVQRYFRDAKLYQIGEGSSQIQQLIISRHLLKDN